MINNTTTLDNLHHIHCATCVVPPLVITIAYKIMTWKGLYSFFFNYKPVMYKDCSLVHVFEHYVGYTVCNHHVVFTL